MSDFRFRRESASQEKIVDGSRAIFDTNGHGSSNSGGVWSVVNRKRCRIYWTKQHWLERISTSKVSFSNKTHTKTLSYGSKSRAAYKQWGNHFTVFTLTVCEAWPTVLSIPYCVNAPQLMQARFKPNMLCQMWLFVLQQAKYNCMTDNRYSVDFRSSSLIWGTVAVITFKSTELWQHN